MIILRIFFRPLMAGGMVGFILLIAVIFFLGPLVVGIVRPPLPDTVELQCIYQPPVEYEHRVNAANGFRPCDRIPHDGKPIAMEGRDDSSRITFSVGSTDRRGVEIRSDVYRAYCNNWDWYDKWQIESGDGRVDESRLNSEGCSKYGRLYSDTIRLTIICRAETQYTIRWWLFDASGNAKYQLSYQIGCVWRDAKS